MELGESSENINETDDFYKKVTDFSDDNTLFKICEISGSIRCKCGTIHRCPYYHKNTINMSEGLIKSMNNILSNT